MTSESPAALPGNLAISVCQISGSASISCGVTIFGFFGIYAALRASNRCIPVPKLFVVLAILASVPVLFYWAIKIGTYSYAIYLVHEIIIMIMEKNIPSIRNNSFFIFPATLMFSIGYAAVDR
jgi:peptidoglycan/LPS O-acetylase OafA/YrhL